MRDYKTDPRHFTSGKVERRVVVATRDKMNIVEVMCVTKFDVMKSCDNMVDEKDIMLHA